MKATFERLEPHCACGAALTPPEAMLQNRSDHGRMCPDERPADVTCPGCGAAHEGVRFWRVQQRATTAA